MDNGKAAALVNDAAWGAHVIVAAGREERREAFETIAAIASTASRILRTNGAERIDFPSGGRILFVGDLRGRTADVLYLGRTFPDHPAILAIVREHGALVRA